MAEHARAAAVHVDLEADETEVRLKVDDDGVGGATPSLGSDLIGLRDRVNALGGTIEIASAAGQGTSLRVEIPLDLNSH